MANVFILQPQRKGGLFGMDMFSSKRACSKKVQSICHAEIDVLLFTSSMMMVAVMIGIVIPSSRGVKR